MSEPAPTLQQAPPQAGDPVLGSATYEIIRQRLQVQSETLRERLGRLDTRRQEVFGTTEFKLLQAHRIVTAHNCRPQDMVQLGESRFLFGFNVRFGLKKEIELGDVFAIYAHDPAAGTYKETPLDPLRDATFITDFKRLYNVYEKSAFHKFSVLESSLFMVFSTGPGPNDTAVFKWSFQDGQLRYLDGRAEAEFRRIGFPPAHEFRWRAPDRESFRYGDHPHISIEDRVFVECVGGDLTIKVEDNTSTGEGVYSEPVEDKYQKVDDAEIAYALIDHLVVLKIRPYKETQARYLIYNQKIQEVVRADSIGQSCVLLPESHGLMFPDGYYLSTGEYKQFESKSQGFTIERAIQAPNGEDWLYVFYSRPTGEYALMPYRLISQRVEERISCHGFSIFPNGDLVAFRGEDEPQKHHLIQLRQTPFHQPGYEPAGRKDTFLYQVGNKEVVRCLAEANEISTLLRKEKPYAALYSDLVKQCGAILDSYPWLANEDACGVDAALLQVRETADKAVDEFDKVRRLQREAALKVKELRRRADERFQDIKRASFKTLNGFVTNLAALRGLRGEIITAREVRYIDVDQLKRLEEGIGTETEQLSGACARFLLKPEALEPYRRQAAAHLKTVESVAKVADGRHLEKEVLAAGGELEMLIEIVNSLRIEDATETTRIIDGITGVYATLNQVKAALKKHLQGLVAAEGAAQFNAQIKLLGQAASSYLDLCSTPAKCDEYLNRLSVQLEELEGAFAGFEEYTLQLADRRAELYEAFEQRKVALVEERSRRAQSLMTAAERILKVIQNRLANFKTVEDINAYMASDLMIAKVRETMQQLLALEDSVKADDLQGRLKSAHQEAVRQLKDRQELFVAGEAVIRLGRHRFNINTQALDLTAVLRDDRQWLHLTGTKYFEAIEDEALIETRDAWGQEVVSENREVYRAEYLAYRLLQQLESTGDPAKALAEFAGFPEETRLSRVQEFMSARYQEGYTKGVHDLDAAGILHALVTTHLALQLARFQPAARGCATVYWHRFCPADTRGLWTAKLTGLAQRNRLFPGEHTHESYIAALRDLLAGWATQTCLYPAALAAEAAEYLFYELVSGAAFTVSLEAHRLALAFERDIGASGGDGAFREARRTLAHHPASELELVRDWARAFLLGRAREERFLEELTALLFCNAKRDGNPGSSAGISEGQTPAFVYSQVQVGVTQVLQGMVGSHPVVRERSYELDYLTFRQKLRDFVSVAVPRFERYQEIKQQALARGRARLRLDEFKPRVLTSFVRNQLIDEVYLPLIGDNLAKQVGAAGEQKRTDLMGLLLVLSPPGYGKTTLMEYLANRLGLVFIKISGPALGCDVTSLDPQEAPNAAAREEVQKLNLALEMGDNVMICVDDIQHCNPEFLQKFISLCDAQRKMEGVWRGQPRTYDLRGRKVVVVMAGNPYTESGQKFKVPDMLANRADTYNLGDIIGGNAAWFKASYLENAVTSNPTLAPLANKSQKDVRTFIRMAEGGERETDFEGSYSAQEVEEILSVMRKLVTVREVLLRVNQEYIHSAAQADEFRTEPAFKLQGSYRNMNRLAEKVAAIMDEVELANLLLDHYRGEAQTLATGAEANLLRFKEMTARLSPEEAARWQEIKNTFRRNQVVRAGDASDPVGRVVGQLSAFQAGLQAIQQTLEKSLTRVEVPRLAVDFGPIGQHLEQLRAAVSEGLAAARAPAPEDGSLLARQLNQGLAALREDLNRAITAVHSGTFADRVASLSHELEMIHSTMATLKDLAAQQRDHLRNAQDLLTTRAKQGTVEIDLTQEMLTNERAFLDKFHQVIADAQGQSGSTEPPAAPPGQQPAAP